MKNKLIGDILLCIFKFLIIALLLFMLILSAFTLLRSLPDEIAGKSDPDFHSGYGLSAFLMLMISLGWNLVCALLAIAGILVSHFYKTSHSALDNKKHFVALALASPVCELVIVVITVIGAAIINRA